MLIIFLIPLQSCSFIIAKSLGISSPTEESSSSQIKYLLKNNVDTANLFQMNDSFAFKLAENKYPMYAHDTVGFKLIQTRVYDGQHEVLFNWASCYREIAIYLDSCTVNPAFSGINKNLSLKEIALNVDDTIKFNELISRDMDFYFVSFWAKYMGKPSLKRLQQIDDFISNSDCHAVHIKVNLGRLE